MDKNKINYNPPVPDVVRNYDNGTEYGAIGQNKYAGVFFEEYEPNLMGRRGIETYKEMADNDDIIGSILFAIEMLIRQVKFEVEPQGTSAKDKEAAEFIQSCMQDMQDGWQDVISEMLSFLPFGWSYHEICYKRRMGKNKNPQLNSKYDDGLIGWHKIPIRSQETLWRWEYDEHDNLAGMTQMAAPDFTIRTVPISKAIHLRTKSRKNNPEGRALALDTPIPTPDGWTTINNLKVGNKVYGSDGKIRYVVAKSPVWENRPVYKLTFSAGDTIIADENHLWNVTTYNDRTNGNPARTLTTKEIYEWSSKPVKSPSFCVGTIPVIDGQQMLLPIDPYILGYWLGDGTHVNGCVSVRSEDYNSLKLNAENAGYKISFNEDSAAYVSGIKLALRQFNLYGNKHIPKEYLRSSTEQRLALLQGLMDSDGTTYEGKDTASKWYNSNELLVKQFCELVRSLGGRPRTRIHSKAGKECGTINGTKIIQKKDLYEVSFYLGFPCHRLERKAKNQDIKDNTRVRGQYIKNIEFIGYQDTVCIEVDSPDHCFIAGEGFINTHNSILRNCYRSYYFKRRMQEIEGIGVERDLAGLPMIQPPEDVNIWDTEDPDMVKMLAYSEKLVRNVRRDATEGIVLPHGWTFSLLNGGSRRQFEIGNIIERYDKRMAMTVLADFVLMGHQAVGSFALSSDKTELFSVAIGTYLDIICEGFNKQAIPRLIELNKDKFGDIEPPKMVHGDVEKDNLTEVSTYLEKMIGIGLIVPDENLAQYARRLGGLPEAVEGAPIPGTDEAIDMKNKLEGQGEKKNETENEEKQAEIAKQLLGR